MPKILVSNINIYYELVGDGNETLVLVNGLADDVESWGEQIDDFLDAGFRVLKIDNRGIGKSDTPVGPYTTALMASDIKAVVDELNITNFHMLGVSMGGMIAQEYALNYQEDLKSLILACTYAAPGPFCLRMFKIWEELAPDKGVPFIMREVTLWAFTQSFFENRPDDLAAFEKEMSEMTQSVDAYLAQLSAICTHDTVDRLSQITVATMTLAGEEDILIPVALSRYLHERLPNSQWRETPGGHACLWETPKPFNEKVLTFLKGNSID